jgi:hypothetical protein
MGRQIPKRKRGVAFSCFGADDFSENNPRQKKLNFLILHLYFHPPQMSTTRLYTLKPEAKAWLNKNSQNATVLKFHCLQQDNVQALFTTVNAALMVCLRDMGVCFRLSPSSTWLNPTSTTGRMPTELVALLEQVCSEEQMSKFNTEDFRFSDMLPIVRHITVPYHEPQTPEQAKLTEEDKLLIEELRRGGGGSSRRDRVDREEDLRRLADAARDMFVAGVLESL